MRSAVVPSTDEVHRVRSVVLGTAGHIDHGKTALVLALTGVDTDRLPEEKSRGITIDLGFAALMLEDDESHTVELSLIDVPGHHAFVRNMLAGAGGIDCVMLVIAATEGIKAQTEEHLAICTLLGIRHGVIALTKSDAVTATRLEEAREEITHFVEHTFLEGAAIVAVSAVTREGIPELKAGLARLASKIPERSTEFVTRLPLDRAFSVRGIGTVVTGTLQSGHVSTDEALVMQPELRSVRVRGLQVHGRPRREAEAPGRVALNLAGVEVGEVKRGMTLVLPATLEAVSTIDAEISMLPGARALQHRARVRVHAFTSEALATVLAYDASADRDRGGAVVRLRLAKPMVLAPGDRFVLRQPSPAMTVGGGRVLDTHPLPRLRKARAYEWLKQLRDATPEEQVELRVRRRGVAGISVANLVKETGMTVAAIGRWVKPLLADGALVSTGEGRSPADHVIAREELVSAAGLLIGEISRAKGGSMSRAELRSKTGLELWVFDMAVRWSEEQRGVRADRNVVSLESAAAGSGAHAKRAAEVEGLYAAAGLASPLVSEVSGKLGVGPKEMHEVITALLRANRLVRLGADNLLIHAEALLGLIAKLRERPGESFDVARFKSFTGLTRKHAIPLLEYLDGACVTRNSNGTRTVL